jgi:transcriptional regulator with XRE-family HTH domain
LQQSMETGMKTDPDDGHPGEDVEDQENARMRQSIRRLLRENHMKPAQLSRKLDKDSGYISQYLAGKQKSLPLEVVLAIAKVFGVTESRVYGKPDNDYDSARGDTISIPFAGTADTGAFRTMANIESQLRDENIRDIASRRLPTNEHFWIEVQDDTMRGEPKGIKKGMAAICVHVDTLPRLGKVYAIRRSNNSGETWETILRYVTGVFPDRIEFSTLLVRGPDEKFNVPLPLTEDSHIKVLGWVYAWRRNDED